jgi:hypothetical protein
MRITIDIDNKDDLTKAIKTGYKLIGRKPDVVRESAGKRGYHLIWYGLKINEDEMFFYREKIGDDPNRIRLDKKVKKNFKQVLFTKKERIIWKN